MIRQCAILFGCLALGELIVFDGYQAAVQYYRNAVTHPFSQIGLDKTAMGAGLSDFLVANGLFLRSARCGTDALF